MVTVLALPEFLSAKLALAVPDKPTTSPAMVLPSLLLAPPSVKVALPDRLAATVAL